MSGCIVVSILAASAVIAAAQKPGDGISKQTYAATDPQASITWLARYLPIQCGDSTAMCNSSDPKCGQKGRVNLIPEDSYSGIPFPPSMSSFMFHQVNTSARPSGPTTVAQVEAVFDEKMSAALQAQRYDSFMDYAVAFWASDLDTYLKKFLADKVPFLALAWEDDMGAAYYSVIFQSPHTQVIVELLSSARPTAFSALVKDSTVRYPSATFSNMGATTKVAADRLRPVAVSKATSDMDTVIDFYKDALGASVIYNSTYADGTRYVIFNPGFSSMQGKMSVRFVQRPASMTTKSLSVKDLEAIKFAGHDWVHDDRGNNTDNAICGFDKWYDNHYGIDGATLTLDQYKANFDRRGWAYYHAWGGFNENIYVVDPTGESIQLDAQWSGSPPPGVSGDALGTMCSQGNCAAVSTRSDSCKVQLSDLCPGLELKDSTCADCAYDNTKHSALKEAGCMNADIVSYCIATKEDHASGQSFVV
jgi:hypothetical protein